MIKKTGYTIPFWQFENLASYEDIFHIVSEREGGTSKPPYDSLNLSFKVGDNQDHVTKNREILASNIGVTVDKLFFPAQIHGNEVSVIKSLSDTKVFGTDGLLTNVPGIFIGVLAADCVPLLLYDPQNQVIGAIHAGWRGTVTGIVKEALKKMKLNFGTLPGNIIAGIGPSISKPVYEVGVEVIAEIEEYFTHTGNVLQYSSKKGKGYFDLWEANKQMLLNEGVPELAIETAGICTYNENQSFFSARRSSGHTGRFAAGIMLKSL